MADAEAEQVFTIGHSTHAIEGFIDLLKCYEIVVLADVRSSPYSRYCPHFNREVLRSALANVGVRYVFLGKELGARPENPSCYERGSVSFSRMARSPEFRDGIRQLRGAARQRLAIMCAEKDPLDCHRAILVGRELVRLGVRVTHILEDGSAEEHASAEHRLVRKLKIEPTLFEPLTTATGLIERAYEEQAGKIAHRDDEVRYSASDKTG